MYTVYRRKSCSPCRGRVADNARGAMIATVLVATSLAWCEDPVERGRETPSPSGASDAAIDVQKAIDDWIEQLGSDEFVIRQRATRELIELGAPVLPSVRIAMDASDPEVRVRAKGIFRRVNQKLRFDRLRAFLLHRELGDHPPCESLPGWVTLRDAVGDTPAARNLLVVTLRDHWDLLEAFERRADDPTKIVSRQIRQLQEARRLDRHKLTVPKVTATLLMAQSPEVKVPKQQLANLLDVLNMPTTSRSNLSDVEKNPMGQQPFRDLVSQVLVRCDDPATARQVFSAALRYNLEAGLQPALTVIKNRDTPAKMLPYALLTIARFGNEEHIDAVRPLLDDTAVYYQRVNGSNKSVTIECQVRDVALATIIHLTSKDPRQFGFTHAKTVSFSVYLAQSLGFQSDEARQQAHEKWENETGRPLIEASPSHRDSGDGAATGPSVKDAPPIIQPERIPPPE